MIFGGVLSCAALLAWLWLRLDLPRVPCPFRQALGVPCPTCGSTRLVEALLQGDLASAFWSNPLVFLGFAVLGVWACASTIIRIFKWPTPRWRVTSGEWLWARVAVVSLTLVGWAYLVLS